MRARKGLLGILHRRPVPIAGVLAVALAAVEVFIDWNTWIELNVSIVFSLPLVLAAAARNRRLLWALTVALIGMTFAVYSVQVHPGKFFLGETFFLNRVLTAVTVLLTAVLLHAWTLALDTLDEQSRSLRDQYEQLEAMNRELLRYQDEIARQNVELDHRRREAEEASGRKTRLLTSVTHDIRTPLNAINLMAEVIRCTADNPTLAAQVPDLAKGLQANALTLADMVSDVLDVSALDSGQVDLHESEFSLNELLTGLCQRLLPLSQAKGLRLTAQPFPSALELRTDRVKLTRVLSNIVTNAIKYTEAGGVTLSVERAPDRSVLIHVRDTGVGIASKDLERIFDEFAQLRNPNHDRGKGWGLGLAICRRLMEVMGGRLTVESQPSRGSVFTVCLAPSCIVGQSEGGPAAPNGEPTEARPHS